MSDVGVYVSLSVFAIIIVAVVADDDDEFDPDPATMMVTTPVTEEVERYLIYMTKKRVALCPQFLRLTTAT